MVRPFFKDRTDAGRQLAVRLASLSLSNPIVYALPRGGVPVAYEVARALEAPLDLILVRKIGAPGNPEVAVAAVTDGGMPLIILNPKVMRWTGATPEYVRQSAAWQLKEIERRRVLYFGSQARPSPQGRSVIIVDDGLATGATARSAIRSLRQQGASRVVLAIPVAPFSAAEEIRPEVDDLMCLHEIVEFETVSQYYDDFTQLADDDVLEILGRAKTAQMACPAQLPPV